MAVILQLQQMGNAKYQVPYQKHTMIQTLSPVARRTE